MNTLLDIVAQKHNDWLKIVSTFGEKEYQEDIVQEMYLKVYKNKDKDVWFKNGNLNVNYIFSILHNIHYDLNKQRRRITKVNVDVILNTIDSDLNDVFEQKELNEIINKEIESWDFYDQKLYEVYTVHERSIRKLHKATGISNKSIFLTLKSCKERIIKRVINETK